MNHFFLFYYYYFFKHQKTVLDVKLLVRQTFFLQLYRHINVLINLLISRKLQPEWL